MPLRPLRLLALGAASAVAVLVRPPAALVAQSPAPAATARPGAVVGTVYDSLSGGPLRDAEVRLDGTDHATTTNAAGRFQIGGVAAGEYVIALDHAGFDSIGVGLPYGKVRVAAGETTFVTLATPSAASVVRRVCSALDPDTAGALLGTVRRADTDAPIPGSRVSARWTEWTPRGRQLRRAEREVAATADDAGAYRLCGVPNDVALQVTATPPPSAGVADVRTGTVLVDLHGRMLTLRNVQVRMFAADSATASARGGDNATLVLRVVDADGHPVEGAQLRAEGRDAPVGVSDASGRLRAANLPAGSQTFQLVALGREPSTVSAELRAGQEVTSTARIGARTAVQLATVRVVGTRSFDRTGFEERRRAGFGDFIGADEVRQRQPTRVSQLLIGRPGFSVSPTGGFGYRVMSNRAAGSINSRCAVQFFVDGVPITSNVDIPAAAGGPAPNAGDLTVDDVVNPAIVTGIELYPSSAGVPVQYRLASRAACGTILIWTDPALRDVPRQGGKS